MEASVMIHRPTATCANCAVRVDDERLQMWISPEEFMCCARHLI